MPSVLMSRATLAETWTRIGKSASCSKAGNLKPQMNTDKHRCVLLEAHASCVQGVRNAEPRLAPRDDLRVLRVSAVRFLGCGYAALCSSVVSVSRWLLRTRRGGFEHCRR